MSPMLVSLIQRFEGYARRLPNGNCVPYLCSAGVLTLGYGSTGRGIGSGVVWKPDQAEARLRVDLLRFESQVFELSPQLAQESEARQAAIMSFAYNCGISAYRMSTLRKAVNRQDWQEAKRQLLRWDKVKGKPVAGLTKRRRIEAEML